MVITEVVVASTIWLNIFPTTDGISATISPRTLVTELNVNYKNIDIFYLDHTSKHTNNMTIGWGPVKFDPFTYVKHATQKEGTILSALKLVYGFINIYGTIFY